MSNITTYLSDELLNHSWGVSAYTMPTVYVALFTTMPTMPAGTGAVEVSSSGTAYVREALAGLLSSAGSGQIVSGSNITWPTATGSWGTILGVGIYDASSAGNLLRAGTLASSVAVGSGGVFYIPAGDLVDALS